MIINLSPSFKAILFCIILHSKVGTFFFKGTGLPQKIDSSI